MTSALLRGHDLQIRIGGLAVVGVPYMELTCQVDEKFIKRQSLQLSQLKHVTQLEMEQVLSDLTVPIRAFIGGPSLTIALVSAMLAGRCAFIGKIGIDIYGSLCRRQLREFGALGWFVTDKEQPTARLLTLITPDKQRTRLAQSAAANDILTDEVNPLALHNSILAYFDSHHVANFEFCKRMMARAKSQGAKVCLSLESVKHTKLHQQSLRYVIYHYVDYLIADLANLNALTETQSLKEVCKAMAAMVQLLVFTDQNKIYYLHQGQLMSDNFSHLSLDAYYEAPLIIAALMHGLRLNYSLSHSATLALKLLEQAQQVDFEFKNINWQLLKDLST